MTSRSAEHDGLLACLSAQRACVLAIDQGVVDVIAFYQDQCRQTDRVLAGLAPDDRPPGVRRPDLPTPVDNVRDVVLHLVEETARHAGHLDIARELLDGRTGLGPR